MAAPSTKQKLLSSIEDVEIITKELFEFLAAPKANRIEGTDTSQLIELLVQKDKEIQQLLETAKEQNTEQQKLDSLQKEVDKRDQDIKLLQKNLKEAESVLATAIYQAKQKLQSINQAQNKRISSEELIKFAHKISASNAVAAPPSWAPGDIRRPYPTDMDMRAGFLGGRVGEVAPQQQQAGTFLDGGHMGRGGLDAGGAGGQQSVGPGGLGWQSSMDVLPPPPRDMNISHHGPPHHGSGGGGGFHSARPHGKENDDVEIMSSDSSSSSSSDE